MAGNQKKGDCEIGWKQSNPPPFFIYYYAALDVQPASSSFHLSRTHASWALSLLPGCCQAAIRLLSLPLGCHNSFHDSLRAFACAKNRYRRRHCCSANPPHEEGEEEKKKGAGLLSTRSICSKMIREVKDQWLREELARLCCWHLFFQKQSVWGGLESDSITG